MLHALREKDEGVIKIEKVRLLCVGWRFFKVEQKSRTSKVGLLKSDFFFRVGRALKYMFLLPLFNDMQYEITLSLFTTNPNSIHPQKREFLRNITKLSGMQGGLGLRNQDAVHSSAYISSIVSCIYDLSKIFPGYIKTDGPQNSKLIHVHWLCIT